MRINVVDDAELRHTLNGGLTENINEVHIGDIKYKELSVMLHHVVTGGGYLGPSYHASVFFLYLY